MIKDVVAAFRFPNNMVAVTDRNGEQIPELQGPYTIELHRLIQARATPQCEWNGYWPLQFSNGESKESV